MKEQIKWWWWEMKRLHRLWVKPEKSAVDLCTIVGIFWLWRRGAKREFKVYPWKDRIEWYSLDICMPHKYKGVEADGEVHHYNGSSDVVRDNRLMSLGWSIMHVTTQQMRADPRLVRKQVRKFLK